MVGAILLWGFAVTLDGCRRIKGVLSLVGEQEGEGFSRLWRVC